MIDGIGVFITTYMIGGSGINEPIVAVSREAAVSDHSVGVVSRLVCRGGGCGSRLFRVFLFSEYMDSLLEVAVVAGMTLAGTIPTLDIRIRGAGRPLIIVPGGLAAFITLSSFLGDGECPQSGHRRGFFRLNIAKRLLNGPRSSSPAICKVFNLRSLR